MVAWTIRHRAYRRRYVFTALLAANREIALQSLREIEHRRQYRRIKSEYVIWTSLVPGTLGHRIRGN